MARSAGKAARGAEERRGGARAGAGPAGIDRPGTGADLGDASTVLPDIPGVASFLGSVEAPPAPSSTGRPGPPGGPGPAGRPDLPLVDTEPLPAADPFGAAGSAPIPGGPTDGAVGDMGEGTATVHRPIRTLDPEPPPADADQRRGGRRRFVIAVAAVIVLVAVAAVVLVTRSPRHPTPVKKVHTVTTVAKDKPTHLALTGTAGKAVLAWTAPAGSRLRYLVVEVTTHGNKVLGKTAAGKTSLTVPAVDPATTQDCFEVTAVLSATKVGAPASWCPTGESVTGG